MHTLICVIFSASWCQGWAATSAFGSSRTFLFTFFRNNKTVYAQNTTKFQLN